MLKEMSPPLLSLASPSLAWPWLHGDIVWMTVLAVALGAGLWRALGAPRRHGWRYFYRQLAYARAAHPRRTRHLVDHPDGLADGEVQMLVGRLRSTGACESYDRGTPVAASTIECPLTDGARGTGALTRWPAVTLRRRADKLALTLDDGAAMIELAGDLEVLVGSRQAHPRQRLYDLPRTLCERVYRDRPAGVEPGALLHEPPVIRNLHEGDLAIVIGRVVAGGAGAHPAADQPYRAPAPRRWLLEPVATGDAPPAITALYAGAPAIPMSPWTRFGLVPAAWLAAATAALALTGSLALRAATRADLVAIDDPATGATTLALRRDRLPVDAPALAVAASTPFHRGAALDLLGRALANSQERGRDLVEARVAIARLRGACAAGAAVLREHRQPRAAIDVATQCIDADHQPGHARHVMGLAFMDLGEYGRASDVFAELRGHLLDPDQDQVGPTDADALSEHALAHTLAESWHEAAATLRRLARRGDRSGHRIAYNCMAEAAAARGGADDARLALTQLALSSRNPVCALLAADLSQDEARRAWLAEPAQGWQGVAWSAHGADARGKRLLYLRELLLREPGGDGPAPPLATDHALRRVFDASMPAGDTPYESLPALEHAVREHLYDASSYVPMPRAHLVRMALTARAAGMEAHLGRSDEAARLRAALMADAETLTGLSSVAAPATLRRLQGDALLLAAATHWRAGDLEAASAALERARSLAPAATVARVESVIALEARGDVHASLASVLTGRPASPGDAYTDEVLDVARSGDGEALAELVEAELVTPNAIGVLAPALATGHDALLDLLRWGRDPGAESVGEALWLDGARAFAAERLGDHASAEQQREAAHRRYLALSNRAPAVLVYLIEHL